MISKGKGEERLCWRGIFFSGSKMLSCWGLLHKNIRHLTAICGFNRQFCQQLPCSRFDLDWLHCALGPLPKSCLKHSFRHFSTHSPCTDQWTDQWTNGPMDQQMDKASLSVACSQLNNNFLKTKT